MKHASLFSGIGGFDLAAQWKGWENVFHCEINSFCNKILNYYWPLATSYNDITTTDFTIHRGTIDVLTGGFPCQPYSQAGKRKGKEDERHLWPEMLRAIREIQPRWVVGENVLVLINWNGALVFHEVQADLEAAGYEVFPYVLPACAIDAPHRRDRVWFVAYSGSDGHKQRGFGESTSQARESHSKRVQRQWLWSDTWRIGETEITADTSGKRSDKSIQKRPSKQFNAHDKKRRIVTDTQSWRQGKIQHTCRPTRSFKGDESFGSEFGIPNWNNWPTQPPICDGNDGFPRKLDGITISKWRNESIKGGGNAIVPQLALQIFNTIELYESKQLAAL